jgi:hypothetical protein
VIKLYESPDLWQKVRDTALDRLRAENDYVTYRSNLSRILSDTLACGAEVR